MRAVLLALLAALLAAGSDQPIVAHRGNETNADSTWTKLGHHIDNFFPNGTGTMRCENSTAYLPICASQPEKCRGSFTSIFNNFAINGLTLSGMLLAFAILHRFPTWAHTLSPLLDTAPCCSITSLASLCCKASDNTISIDGWVLIRFCMLGFKFSMLGTIIGCILVPVYVDGERLDYSDFQTYTIANLSSETWKVWLVVASSFALTIGFCILMWKEWTNYVTLRRDHFMSLAKGELGAQAAQAKFSLMVERIPPKRQCHELLKMDFERVFDSLNSVMLVPDTAHKYDKLFLGKGACCCCKCCRCCTNLRGMYEDGIDHLMRLNQTTRHRMRVAHGVLVELRAPGGPTSTGFLTLNSVADQQIALQQVSLFHSRSRDDISYGDYRVRPAPEARDLIWRNAGTSHSQEVWRCRSGDAACVLGLMAWFAPLLAVTTLTSAEGLERSVPAVTHLLKKVHFLYNLFLTQGYLSVIAIQGLLLLLPYALDSLSVIWECRKQKTVVARKVLIRNLYFQLASLYFLVPVEENAKSHTELAWHVLHGCELGEVIGGVLSQDLFNVLINTNFPCLAEKFGRSVLQVGVYFINFVMARIGLTLPLLLLRPWALLCAVRCSISTHEYKEPVYCWIGYEGTNLVIVLVVANMYAIIAPLVMVICTVYFALAACVYKYLFQFVYTPEFDCQGRFWEELFDGAMTGVALGIISVTGVIMMKVKTLPAFFAMLVLLLLVVGFFQKVKSFYMQRSCFMPYEDAMEVDRTVGPDVVRTFDVLYYQDPIERPEFTDNLEPVHSDGEAEDSPIDDTDQSAELCESRSVEEGSTDVEEDLEDEHADAPRARSIYGL